MNVGGGKERRGLQRRTSKGGNNGKEEVPRRYLGSSSVEPENGMVGCPSGTKIAASGGDHRAEASRHIDHVVPGERWSAGQGRQLVLDEGWIGRKRDRFEGG